MQDRDRRHLINPTVQAQRLGYCVRHEPSGLWLASLFATYPPDRSKGWGDAKDALVFGVMHDATVRAKFLGGCVATTVPRWDGHCMSWVEINEGG